MRSVRIKSIWLAAMLACAASSAAVSQSSAAADIAGVTRVQGRTASGSRWLGEKPANWNGTLLLWSHGYSPVLLAPGDGPRGTRAKLLSMGYGLVGSSYSSPGWALQQAVPDQIAAIDAFTARLGHPKQVIAWGDSMGGLLTADLMERHPERFAGAITACASAAGAIGMMNMALDGAFAFITLEAPDAGIRLVNTKDDRTNGTLVAKAVAQAQQTPAGRARLALAAVLAGLPGWTYGATPPAAMDYAAQEAQMAHAFAMGVFLPRADQEARAGGVFSWNTGVDYVAQLRRSGRRPMVQALYRAAELSLDADLARLNAAPRIAADPRAVAYMGANFTPSGQVFAPVLIMHTIGDGMTSPSLPASYQQIIRAAGRPNMVALAWNARAGHCSFSGPEMIAGLEALELRIDQGSWNVAPETLNRAAMNSGDPSPTFTGFTPPPALRVCRFVNGQCKSNGD